MALRISECLAVVGAALFACAGGALAGNAAASAMDPPTTPTPLGTWTTIDDVSHQPRSLVRISEHDGVLSGRIVRLFRGPDEDPDPRCGKCEGARHDQRVIGMTILWGLHRDGDAWNGGEILDPESGSIYRVTLHPADGGQTLQVRGYIGFSLLGRTQVWQRAASS